MKEMWLARDEDNSLYLYYEEKPVKYFEKWRTSISSRYIRISCGLFSEVKWSDDEPTKVKLVIDK